MPSTGLTNIVSLHFFSSLIKFLRLISVDINSLFKLLSLFLFPVFFCFAELIEFVFNISLNVRCAICDQSFLTSEGRKRHNTKVHLEKKENATASIFTETATTSTFNGNILVQTKFGRFLEKNCVVCKLMN